MASLAVLIADIIVGLFAARFLFVPEVAPYAFLVVLVSLGLSVWQFRRIVATCPKARKVYPDWREPVYPVNSPLRKKQIKTPR